MLQEILLILSGVIGGALLFYYVLRLIPIFSINVSRPRGQRLKFRIPYRFSWGVSILAFCVLAFLSGGCFIAFYRALNGAVEKSPFIGIPLVLVLVGIPFSILLLLAWWTAHELIAEFGVKPTLLETSAGEWQSGENYKIWISQSGPLRLNGLNVKLKCNMSLRRKYGKGTRLISVYDETLFETGAFEIGADIPFVTELTCHVPHKLENLYDKKQNSMDYYCSSIDWHIEVYGDIKTWPNFCRWFYIEVRG